MFKTVLFIIILIFLSPYVLLLPNVVLACLIIWMHTNYFYKFLQ